MIERKEIITSLGNISYLDTIQGNKTIIYIHGAFGGPDAIEVINNHLGKDGWRIIAPCLPGHGQSFSLDKHMCYEDIVSAIEEFIGNFPNVKVICGHSFGARLAFDVEQRKTRVLFAPMLRNVNNNFLNTLFNVVTDFSKVKKINSKLKERDLKQNFTRIKDMKLMWNIVKNLPYFKLNNNFERLLIMAGNKDLVIHSDKGDRLFLQKISDNNLKIYDGGHYWFLNEGKHWDDLQRFISNKY